VRARLVLAPVEDFESIREEWSALIHGTSNVFATWEWASTWWRHLGRHGRLFLIACREADGRLTALLPLYFWLSGPMRVARLVGHHAGDHLGPICKHEDRGRVAVALGEALSTAGVDVFIGEQLAASEGWDELLQARVLSREGSPVLQIGDLSWDDYLAARSRNFREQIRRRERKLVREHGLRFRLADDPDRLGADLDLLFRLHRDRWGGRHTNFSSREGFHRDFALESFRRGWLRLWFAELDGEPAAAWYGFRYGQTESYYQAGRASKWARSSIGFALLAHSVREAFRDRMREYRFLRGGEEYKYRFTNHDPGLETIALSRGSVGRLVVPAALAMRRLRRVPQRLLPRRPRSARSEP
jgi:CelD/BcsL family acetyltransferase involved in cellulose biosynthesis